jgi:hypothetical protein
VLSLGVCESFSEETRSSTTALIRSAFLRDDSPDHSGHIHFFLANTSSGVWVLQCNERRSENIVAVCEEAPDDLAAKEIAKTLYEAVEEDGGKVVDEPTDYGLIDW